MASLKGVMFLQQLKTSVAQKRDIETKWATLRQNATESAQGEETTEGFTTHSASAQSRTLKHPLSKRLLDLLLDALFGDERAMQALIKLLAQPGLGLNEKKALLNHLTTKSIDGSVNALAILQHIAVKANGHTLSTLMSYVQDICRQQGNYSVVEAINRAEPQPLITPTPCNIRPKM